MPRLVLEVPHSLSLEEATARLKKKFADVRAEHHDRVSHFRDEWVDHTFSFAFQAMGMTVDGTVAVEAGRIKLDARLPLAVALFKSAIEQRIRQEVGEMLAPQNA